jgi:hypothetical protein
VQSKADIRSAILALMIEVANHPSRNYGDLTDSSSVSRVCFDRCLIDGTRMEVYELVDDEMQQMASEGIIEEDGYSLFRVSDVLTAFVLAVNLDKNTEGEA